MNILVVGAHDDDWDEFCGGTMSLYARAGHTLGVVSMTNGCNSGTARSASELGQIRKKEFETAAALLGTCKTYWPGIEDGHLENKLEIRILVAKILTDFHPDVIFTHPPADYHPDHNATSQLVLDASLSAHILAVGPKLRYRGAEPIPKPLYSAYPVIYFFDSEDGHGFLPDEYVDITAAWEIKERMMMVHRSQYETGTDQADTQTKNHLLAETEIIGRYRGLQCGVSYAEAFKLYHAAGRIHPGRLLP